MRKRSRPHDYRKVLWDDSILFLGRETWDSVRHPRIMECPRSQRTLRDDVKMNAEVEMMSPWSGRSTGDGLV